ncbi:MAG TPA: PAS domain-containing protein [Nitrospira sp.]|jgi:PAS domain S-box-containing protein|nr:PAS domain-containing protein [Nitrospira sp.]
MKTADLMTTLEGISDAVVRLDGQGKCMTMNQAAEHIVRGLGRDPGKMIGESVWALFPGLRGTVAEQRLRHALDDQRPIQYELYSPVDQRWYDAQGFPSSPGVVLIFRDTTELKTGQPSGSIHPAQS